MATKSPSLRNLRVNLQILCMTLEAADCLAQLWPHVEKLDLEKRYFNGEILGILIRHYPLLKRLKIEAPCRAEVQLFDTIFSNHPIRSYYVPLEKVRRETAFWINTLPCTFWKIVTNISYLQTVTKSFP